MPTISSFVSDPKFSLLVFTLTTIVVMLFNHFSILSLILLTVAGVICLAGLVVRVLSYHPAHTCRQIDILRGDD
jgi:hypothetical protein